MSSAAAVPPSVRLMPAIQAAASVASWATSKPAAWPAVGSLREGKGYGQPLQASIAVSDLNL
jgi:hypothetical protein